MIVLGIETSCDETACAVIERAAPHAAPVIRSNIVLSQLEDHRPYGGVVPEIAARAHLTHVDSLVQQAMAEAGLDFADLSGVAATAGPGLIGGVIVGAMTAKAIAMVHNLPFIAVNHLEGHALTVRLTNKTAFPYLLLLASGGHCQLLEVEALGQYRRIGTTIDDAAGEAFDKVAKMLGLGYPGGPAVERAARHGDPTRFAFPRPLLNRPGCDFSFSGLKTAVRQAAEALPPGDWNPQDIYDICASFQAAVAECMAKKSARAMKDFSQRHGKQHADGTPYGFVVAGGVAANTTLRQHLQQAAATHGMAFVAPPLHLCTDNGAMIAWAGLEHLAAGHRSPLDFKPRPRWPLDPNGAKRPGAGIKA